MTSPVTMADAIVYCVCHPKDHIRLSLGFISKHLFSIEIIAQQWRQFVSFNSVYDELNAFVVCYKTILSIFDAAGVDYSFDNIDSFLEDHPWIKNVKHCERLCDLLVLIASNKNDCFEISVSTGFGGIYLHVVEKRGIIFNKTYAKTPVQIYKFYDEFCLIRDVCSSCKAQLTVTRYGYTDFNIDDFIKDVKRDVVFNESKRFCELYDCVPRLIKQFKRDFTALIKSIDKEHKRRYASMCHGTLRAQDYDEQLSKSKELTERILRYIPEVNELTQRFDDARRQIEEWGVRLFDDFHTLEYQYIDSDCYDELRLYERYRSEMAKLSKEITNSIYEGRKDYDHRRTSRSEEVDAVLEAAPRWTHGLANY